MSTKTDGGPAFPLNRDDGSPTGHLSYNEGLSLRDYFAAAALTGIMANRDLLVSCRDRAIQRGYEDSQAIAIMAGEVADAMLAERDKQDD